MMMKKRCHWVNLENELYVKYHDEEWGVRCHNDRRLFEMLILEGAQAGLSWETILNKRFTYRKAFRDFNPKLNAQLTEAALRKILRDPGVIRNRLKIWSVRDNARAFLEVKKEFGTFDGYLMKTIGACLKAAKHGAAREKCSAILSQDLKKRGFRFVGPTIMYAFMQAVGLVDDHSADCFRRSRHSRRKTSRA